MVGLFYGEHLPQLDGNSLRRGRVVIRHDDDRVTPVDVHVELGVDAVEAPAVSDDPFSVDPLVSKAVAVTDSGRARFDLAAEDEFGVLRAEQLIVTQRDVEAQ